MSSSNTKISKGPWINRFLVWLFSIILALTSFWFINFIIEDVGKISGPSYNQVLQEFQDTNAITKKKVLTEHIEKIKTQIQNKEEEQRLLKDSTETSQRTMNQLIDLQKSYMQKGVKSSLEEQQALAESQKLFLSNQKKYQKLNENIFTLTEESRGFQTELDEVNKIIEDREIPAKQKFNKLEKEHDLKMAFLKILILIPLLSLAVYFGIKKSGSIYRPIVFSLGFAISAKMILVIHEVFPKEFFKYILILFVIVLVIKVLIYLIKMVAEPKKDWLLKQYRESFDKFECPFCSYKIRRGALKYFMFTKKAKQSFNPNTDIKEEVYTCPSCGKSLYDHCEKCNSIRNIVLPFCQNCGNEHNI